MDAVSLATALLTEQAAATQQSFAVKALKQNQQQTEGVLQLVAQAAAAGPSYGASGALNSSPAAGQLLYARA